MSEMKAARLDASTIVILDPNNGAIRIHQAEIADAGVLFPERSIWLCKSAAKDLADFIAEANQ